MYKPITTPIVIGLLLVIAVPLVARPSAGRLSRRRRQDHMFVGPTERPARAQDETTGAAAVNRDAAGLASDLLALFALQKQAGQRSRCVFSGAVLEAAYGVGPSDMAAAVGLLLQHGIGAVSVDNDEVMFMPAATTAG